MPPSLHGLPPRWLREPAPPPVGEDLMVQILTVDSEDGAVPFETPGVGMIPPCPDLQSDEYFAAAEAAVLDNAREPWKRAHKVKFHVKTAEGLTGYVEVLKVKIKVAVEFPETHPDYHVDGVPYFRRMERELRYRNGELLNAAEESWGLRARSNNWIPDPADKTKPKRFPVCYLEFENMHAYRKAVRYMNETEHQGRDGFGFKVSVWETTDYVKPHQRFMLEHDLVPGGWIRIANSQPLAWTCTTGAAFERWCLGEDITPVHDDDAVAKLCTASIDIEVKNGTAEQRAKMKEVGLDRFPRAADPTNSITQISIHVVTPDDREIAILLQHDDRNEYTGDRAIESRVFEGQEYTVVHCQAEVDMVTYLRDVIHFYDADLVLTFNGDRFDWPYLLGRLGCRAASDANGRGYQLGRECHTRWATQYMPFQEAAGGGRDRPVFDMDRAKGKKALKKEKQLPRKHFALSELALQRGAVLTPELTGRVCMDVCSFIKAMSTADKYLQFKNFTLNNMAARFLNDKKLDLKHNDIFDAWNGQMSAQRMLQIICGVEDPDTDDSWLLEPPAMLARAEAAGDKLEALQASKRAATEAAVDAWLGPMCGVTVTKLRALALEANAAMDAENAWRAEQRRELRRELRANPEDAGLRQTLRARIVANAPLREPTPAMSVVPLAAQRRLLGDYCIKDSVLPTRIVGKLGLVMFLWQLARVTSTAPHNLINNGQMMRVSTMFLKEAWAQGRYVNRVKNRAMAYQGATVLKPKRGYYGGADRAAEPLDPQPPLPEGYDWSGFSEAELVQRLSDIVVITLDFKSLYPSIMMSHDFCPSTLFQPDEPLTASELSAKRYRKHIGAAEAVDDDRPETDADADVDSAALSNRYETLAAEVADAEAALPRLPPAERGPAQKALTQMRAGLDDVRSKLQALAADEGFEDDGDDDDDDAAPVEVPDALGARIDDDGSDSGVVTGLDDEEDYTTICVVLTDDDDATVGRRYHKYTKHDKGIYPVLLKRLLDGRGVYKKKMKLEANLMFPLRAAVEGAGAGDGDEGVVDSDAPNDVLAAVDVLRQRIKAEPKRKKELATAWVAENRWILDPAVWAPVDAQIDQNHNVYDGRQKALKVSANSIYGVSGAKQHSPCACCKLAESVTAVGRQMIADTKEASEVQFAKYGCVVVYGDTDSVFVMVHVKNRDDAWGIGDEIADYVTHVLLKGTVNELENEALKWNFALWQKKNYAGYEQEPNKPVDACQKGVATVRRDKPEVLNKLLRKILTALRDLGNFERETIARQMLRITAEHFEGFVQNAYGVDDYVIAKRINKTTKESEHIVMAKKMEARTGAPVLKGDTVMYVHVHDPAERLASRRVESPVMIKKHPETYKIDVAHYLVNKLDSIRTTLSLFLPPEVTDTLFTTYHHAIVHPKQRYHAQVDDPAADPTQIRIDICERALKNAIAQGRLPRVTFIPKPMLGAKGAAAARKKDKREVAIENHRQATEFASLMGFAAPSATKQAKQSKPKKKTRRPASTDRKIDAFF